MVFNDVLSIKNGKNQRAVENPEGKYPIYGSGGIMGYADDYICQAQTVIIGRKGSINNPIFVEEPVWNVDTAFGLEANRKLLNPRYLFYFCRNYDFERLNKAVTIPSLTKTDLLKIEIELPDLKRQQEVVDRLLKVEKVLSLRKKELEKFDDLIKARFVEMFGDYEWSTTVRNYIAELRGGKSLAGTEPCKNKVLKTGAATFGWFDPEQYKYLPQDYEPLPEHKVETGDVMISRMNTPDLVGACSYVFKAPEDMYYPDRLWKVIPKNQANPIFIWQLLWDPEIRRQIKDKSGGTSGTMHNISKLKLLDIKCIDVPVSEQNKFADFVKQVDKSKVAIQKSLDETQVLFDSLMQEYFG